MRQTIFFFRFHSRAITAGKSSHAYEYTEKVKIISLILTTDVWQLSGVDDLVYNPNHFNSDPRII